MKRSLKELISYNIATMDDTRAKVKDFLFDEETWALRYMEVDFGDLFKSKRILIPRMLLKDSQLSNGLFHTELTKEDIEKCPKPEDHLTVSRKYEEELNKYYRLDNYWAHIHPGEGIRDTIVSENDLNTSLRSFNEVKGYEIHATDGKLGHVDDMFVDDKDWQIAYAIVDTSNWLPWSKRVVLTINQIDEICYEKGEARVSLHTNTIKNAPGFDANRSIDLQYKTALHDYYERTLNRGRKA